MVPTEGRVAKPERRWGCHRGTPNAFSDAHTYYHTVWSNAETKRPIGTCKRFAADMSNTSRTGQVHWCWRAPSRPNVL